MSDQKKVQQLKAQLFPEQGMTVFALLDGASIPDLPGNLAAYDLERVCLLRGLLPPEQDAAAPYLVALERDSLSVEWLLDQGWGKHWGIFAVSSASIRVLRDHFRKFLTVYDEKAASLYFRYYDPRVLQVFIPTFNKVELSSFFGPVSRFLAESDDGSFLLSFSNDSGRLVLDRLKLG